MPLEAVAFVTQSLIIDNCGNVVPTSIATEVQVREFNRSPDGRLSKTEIADFELSRRAMLTKPASGGLVRFDETAPACLPASGNDYSFAAGIDSADGRVRDISIMASLRARCVGCHGANVATLFTFSKQNPRAGEIRVLGKQANEHGQYVVKRKTKLDSWKSLQEYWAASCLPSCSSVTQRRAGNTVGHPTLNAAGFQPAFPRGAEVCRDAKKPPKRRLQARLLAPQDRQP